MEPQKIYLKDYTKPAFQISNAVLHFNLHEDVTQVRQRSTYHMKDGAQDLWLDGEQLTLKRLALNGKELSASEYRVQEKGLKILKVPESFELEIETELKPQLNTSLEGLYKSNSVFCTQCEAQGFRKITYFPDRPDVMTNYLVHIEADAKKYPILLSNGDCVATETLANGRHVKTWKDPFAKPCYLFALVAGDLGCLRDTFITKSGKTVNLEIYSAWGTQDRCHHAMLSLKKAMKWDEDRFGLEYDLSSYMILAIDDFNAGAMENKGLNIFNSRLIFADPKTATDLEYYRIESVVAHEYFHNWTGNRVTLRDWFHLSLKEGLTVFRDQEFSMDLSSRDVVRLENVAELREGQFAEDAGPNAHPIRPESCFAVDNFFTSTIYEKGAEIIRMMQTLVGRPGFRKGMDLYFKRHDGQAVIIEDYASAISEANNQNWEQFKRWYSQAGTPQVQVQEKFDSNRNVYQLTLRQETLPTPEQPLKEPFHIPLVFGLLDSKGKEIPLAEQKSISKNSEGQMILHLCEKEQTFEFAAGEKPTPSLNRQFSAPIHLKWEASDRDLLFLMKHDSDNFNRCEASQQFFVKSFLQMLSQPTQNLAPEYLQALKTILVDEKMSEPLRAAFLAWPENSYLAQHVKIFSSQNFYEAWHRIESQTADFLEFDLLTLYQQLHTHDGKDQSPRAHGIRKLKNRALKLLSQKPQHRELAQAQFTNPACMTDEAQAFEALLEMDGHLRTDAIEKFYDKWHTETLVLNKWFTSIACSQHTDTFKTVVKLSEHKDFNIKNPNRVYSLLNRFGENLIRFHDPSQNTYGFLADKIIEIDKINPQVATRVAGQFDFSGKLPEAQKNKAHSEILRMSRSGLSKNTYEIVSKQLASFPQG